MKYYNGPVWLHCPIPYPVGIWACSSTWRRHTGKHSSSASHQRITQPTSWPHVASSTWSSMKQVARPAIGWWPSLAMWQWWWHYVYSKTITFTWTTISCKMCITNTAKQTYGSDVSMSSLHMQIRWPGTTRCTQLTDIGSVLDWRVCGKRKGFMLLY